MKKKTKRKIHRCTCKSCANIRMEKLPDNIRQSIAFSWN